MCVQLSKHRTMFFGAWGLHNPPAIPQLLQPPEELTDIPMFLGIDPKYQLNENS